MVATSGGQCSRGRWGKARGPAVLPASTLSQFWPWHVPPAPPPTHFTPHALAVRPGTYLASTTRQEDFEGAQANACGSFTGAHRAPVSRARVSRCGDATLRPQRGHGREARLGAVGRAPDGPSSDRGRGTRVRDRWRTRAARAAARAGRRSPPAAALWGAR